MSKIVKSVKKVFKKVGKVIKKVAPVALAVGALVFTGGAALGLAPMAGGWAGAASAITAKLGAGGVLGGALTGAITQAGYGALAGGSMAAVTGGDVRKGLLTGAGVGAITGGVTGGWNAASAARQATAGVPNASGTIEMGDAYNATTGAGVTTPTATGTGSAAPGTTSSRGLLSRVTGEGSWLERNQALVGNVVGGIGEGLMTSASADAELDMMRERSNEIRRNYEGVEPGANYRTLSAEGSGVTPSQRFGQRLRYQFQYNPQSQRIERVEIG